MTESISDFRASDHEVARRVRSISREPTQANQLRELRGTIAIKNTYVEEHLLRSLYEQRVRQRAEMLRNAHMGTMDRNRRVLEAAGSPYMQEKIQATETIRMVSEAERLIAPQFRDVQRVVTPRLQRDNLRSRRQTVSTATRRPASPRSIAATMQLPELSSLLSPPWISPVPPMVDRRSTLESMSRVFDTPSTPVRPASPGSPVSSMGGAEGLKPVSFQKVMREIGYVYDLKLNTDAKVHEKAATAGACEIRLMPLVDALRENLAHQWAPALLPEKMDQLRLSCHPRKHHGWHPRIGLFRIFCWGKNAFTAKQDIACMRLLSWLNIASKTPPSGKTTSPTGDIRLLLPLGHASKLARNLRRLKLVPTIAVTRFEELAESIKIPPEELPPPQRQSPHVDADQLLLLWMEKWDWCNDIEVAEVIPESPETLMEVPLLAIDQTSASSRLSTPASELRPPPLHDTGSRTVNRTLGNHFDSQEGPDTVPISMQLASALKANSARVLDLFRNWGMGGDGEISRKEFRRAMPALGWGEVPAADIDELFGEWGRDGGGVLSLQELENTLRAPALSNRGRTVAPPHPALSKRGRGGLVAPVHRNVEL